MYTQQQPERPFTVNIMNGVGWVGSSHPSSEPQSWAEPVSSDSSSSSSQVHVIICMAECRATGSRVSPTGETDRISCCFVRLPSSALDYPSLYSLRAKSCSEEDPLARGFRPGQPGLWVRPVWGAWSCISELVIVIRHDLFVRTT